jgi:hypothetical protein
MAQGACRSRSGRAGRENGAGAGVAGEADGCGRAGRGTAAETEQGRCGKQKRALSESDS